MLIPGIPRPAKLLRRRLALTALAAFACLVPGLAAAQTDADRAVRDLDIPIATVVSGGSWKTSTTEGTFRLIETSEGWETIRRRVFVQWLEVSQERRRVTVRRTIELQPRPEVFSMSDPRLVLRNGVWYATVRTASRPLAQPDQEAAFELGGPGTARRMRGGLPRARR
jgi:hypothetical protein